MRNLSSYRTYTLMLVFLSWCAVAIGVQSCRVPPPGTPPGPIVCTTEAIQKCWPGMIGPVNSCLTSMAAVPCLLGLIQPTGCAVEQVIACLVQRQVGEFAAAARINPDDERSARAADNARQFIAERGYTFSP